jgi:hypothetical protein
MGLGSLKESLDALLVSILSIKLCSLFVKSTANARLRTGGKPEVVILNLYFSHTFVTGRCKERLFRGV